MKIKRYPLGALGAFLVILFILMGVYAPLLASSKPLAIEYDHQIYFPLLRYLFFQGFFTKPLDIFFNLMMFTLPLAVIFWKKTKVLTAIGFLQCALFLWLMVFGIKDPASDPELTQEKQKQNQVSWRSELSFMNDYAKLNEVVRYILRRDQDANLKVLLKNDNVPSLFSKEQEHQNEKIQRINAYLAQNKPENPEYQNQLKELQFIKDKNQWLQNQAKNVSWMMMPLVRPFHWEDDAGGEQALNQYLPWWDLTRVNRKDLVAALIFGVRISLVVGFLAVGLSLLLGIPIGAFAGYYGGVFDMIVSRMIEIWESMPVFFMLLLVIAMMQSKSIFIVITVIGVFGWTGFSRYIRGEFFKQKNLGYVESCKSIGYPDSRIIFRHILPNAIPPLLTLLPFAIMGAITAEAGLSFLGLGEEGSCSWGVLMDEGRSAFPGEAYLLWPPAIFLTILLVAIALIGDALRDHLDPKTH